jgi:hypothetical protein
MEMLTEKMKQVDIDIEKIAKALFAMQIIEQKNVNWYTTNQQSRDLWIDMVRAMIAQPEKALHIAYEDDQKFWRKANDGNPNRPHQFLLLPFEEWVNTELGREGMVLVNIVAALAFGVVAKIGN